MTRHRGLKLAHWTLFVQILDKYQQTHDPTQGIKTFFALPLLLSEREDKSTNP